MTILRPGLSIEESEAYETVVRSLHSSWGRPAGLRDRLVRKVSEKSTRRGRAACTSNTAAVHIDYGTTVLSVWPITGRA